MTEATGTAPLVVSRHIAASPETLFEFWTDPEKVTRWLAAEATADPRPGGTYHQIHIDHEGTRHVIQGEFIEVDPPSRLLFSWPDGPSTVEVTLEPQAGGTLVTIVHRDLPPAVREDHEHGWRVHLETLSRVGPAG